MSLNIAGLVVMVLFYLLVLGTGIWASMKSNRLKKSSQADITEVTLLGNRGISLVVGIFTMTGLVVMVLFYLLVLGTGIWASMKSNRLKKSSQADITEVTLLGNRGISLVVGIFTMTAMLFASTSYSGVPQADYFAF
ncbi:hypothetical protein JOQ06_023709 [Pogonophryne albipinna]|uniref:Uncharacterized protein n=1 Tax=Pogonophryne albipinna TaxID=1090488 RepID=A0AAD6BLR1_9TELE|nr:hypothetical protein JOQ06_023709 [Pogonophryne albipinna]